MVDFSKLNKAFDAAKNLAGKHGDKLDDVIDKGVGAVDKATGGKHHDKITQNAEKLKDAAGKFADQDAPAQGDARPPVDPDAPRPGEAGAARPADAPVPDPDAPKDAR